MSNNALPQEILVWTTHSLDKVFPKTKPPRKPVQFIKLNAAGNETEDAQILIRSKNHFIIKNISVRFNSLKDENKKDGNNIISNENIQGHWVWYTWVRQNPPRNYGFWTYLKRAPAFFPDAFLEEKEIRILSEWTQPLWISIHVPSNTPKGLYRGSAIFDLDYFDKRNGNKFKTSFSIPIEVSVWDFSLPKQNTLHHTEWIFPDILARYYRINKWSEKHWDLLHLMAKDIAKHHQDMVLTPIFDLVDVKKRENGEITYDFNRLERWLNIFGEAGIQWIECHHIATKEEGRYAIIKPKRIQLINSNGLKIPDCSPENMSESDYIPYLEQFMKKTYEFLGTKWDLKKCVQHICDEPMDRDQERWLYLAGLVRSWIPPEVKIIDAVFSKKLGKYLNIRVPQIQEISAKERIGKDLEEKHLWCYVCLAPQGLHPNRFIDYASIRNRIIFWISYSLKLEGFLHWGYNFWGSWTSAPKSVDISPWMDATAGSVLVHKRQPLPAGDPFLVYPGQDSICSSIRWEVIRKGMEDHKLLTLFEDLVEKDKKRSIERNEGIESIEGARLLEQIRKKIAKDSRHYTRNSRKLLKLRIQIGDLVEKMLNKH